MRSNGMVSPEEQDRPDEESERRERLVEALVAGEMALHKLPDDLSAQEAASIRRAALERMTDTQLEGIGQYAFDAQQASNHNCENLIGAAQIPMGVVGPLPVRGEHVSDDVYVPLATTEGALLASINRGCAALRASEGATVHVEDVGMTRAPVFRTSGIRQTQELLRWVEENEDEIREVAESTSRYLTLLEIKPTSFGTTVYLRFRFESGDAMGMNMVTIACDRVVQELIEPMTGVTCVSLSGNYCVDKKPAQVNFQEGRGKRVHAEVVLEEPVLRRYLKTTAQALSEVQYRKNMLGSVAAGSMGYNSHYANIVAAFFVATGQDIAQVVEGSMGVTCIEPRKGGSVYVSVYLPDLPVGAVGGGTGLQTQREALSMMGIELDPNHRGQAAMRLAEVLGGAVLAGELSLMGALSARHLARAHQEMARGKAESQEVESALNGLQ